MIIKKTNIDLNLPDWIMAWIFFMSITIIVGMIAYRKLGVSEIIKNLDRQSKLNRFCFKFMITCVCCVIFVSFPISQMLSNIYYSIAILVAPAILNTVFTAIWLITDKDIDK